LPPPERVIDTPEESNTVKIDVMRSVYDKNERLAAEFNAKLTGRRVFCVNVLGAPGAGKTTVLIRIVEALGASAFVIEGDIESDIDARKLKALGIPALQINTGGACHLDAPIVADAFLGAPSAGEAGRASGRAGDTGKVSADAGRDFSGGFLFIENIGNLVCPAEFMIGEHVKLLVCAVTDGSDKPYKYPLAFEKADIILLNKCDLLEYIDFDRDFFLNGVRKLNPSAPVVHVSGKTGAGIGEAVKWLRDRAQNIIGS